MYFNEKIIPQFNRHVIHSETVDNVDEIIHNKLEGRIIKE